MNIFGVHLDRQATLPNAKRIQEEIESHGQQAVFFNMNAADQEKRSSCAREMEQVMEAAGTPGDIRLMLHSLAFGTLKPMVGPTRMESLTRDQMSMTLNVMAHSLVYWVQELVWNGLMGAGGRVYALTSSGASRVMPSYGAVSAAKAALESHIRQLTLELKPLGISANAIRAGVTDTPALRKIPGHERAIEHAINRNPGGRLTTPEDVAKALVLLAQPGTEWMTGNVIGVDGGEDIVA
jgi:enoyl-[acyl-carrier-protein] reductase (NADH)